MTVVVFVIINYLIMDIFKPYFVIITSKVMFLAFVNIVICKILFSCFKLSLFIKLFKRSIGLQITNVCNYFTIKRSKNKAQIDIDSVMEQLVMKYVLFPSICRPIRVKQKLVTEGFSIFFFRGEYK